MYGLKTVFQKEYESRINDFSMEIFSQEPHSLAKECSISVNVKMVTAAAFFKEKSINSLVDFMFIVFSLLVLQN